MAQVHNFLRDYGEISKEVKDMLYHLGIEFLDLKEVLSVCGIDTVGKSKDMIAAELTDAILSCYPNSENYNDELYIQLVRKGTQCDKFYVEGPEYSEEDLPEDDYGHGSLKM